MANFKVGDKARIRGATYPDHLRLNGLAVEIVGPLTMSPQGYNSYRIDIPGESMMIWWRQPQYLEPLTDPKADQFIARVKSWKPEPVPEKLPELGDVLTFYKSL